MMKIFERPLRFRLIWRVLRLPRKALEELDETLVEMREFYDMPMPPPNNRPPTRRIRARFGDTFVRAEFPIVPSDYIEIAPIERKP